MTPRIPSIAIAVASFAVVAYAFHRRAPDTERELIRFDDKGELQFTELAVVDESVEYFRNSHPAAWVSHDELDYCVTMGRHLKTPRIFALCSAATLRYLPMRISTTYDIALRAEAPGFDLVWVSQDGKAWCHEPGTGDESGVLMLCSASVVDILKASSTRGDAK